MTGPQLGNEPGAFFFREDSPSQMPLPATTTDGVMRPGATPGRLRVLVLTKIFPNARQPFAAAFNRQQFAALARRADLQVVVPVQWFPGAAQLRGPDRGRQAGARAWLRLGRRDVRALPAGLSSAAHRLSGGGGPVRRVALAAHAPSLPWRGRRPRLVHLPRRGGGDLDGAACSASRRWSTPSARTSMWSPRSRGCRRCSAGPCRARPGWWRSAASWRKRAWRSARVPKRWCWSRTASIGRSSGRAIEPRPGAIWGSRRAGAGSCTSAGSSAPRGSRSCWRPSPPCRPRTNRSSWSSSAMEPCERAATRRRRRGRGACWSRGRGRWPRCRAGWRRRILLVLPSWAEGTPNVILEALASGRPVVATQTGGIPDLLSAPELGEMCQPRDVAGLAAALRKVLDGRHDPDAISTRGTVSWQESADRLLEVLKSAAAER